MNEPAKDIESLARDVRVHVFQAAAATARVVKAA